MANSIPPSSPANPPVADPLEAAQANLVAAQQAFVAAQQNQARAENAAVLTGAASTTINITLDPDLSALFNDPSVQASNAFKAVIAALQAVRLGQQAASLLSAILAKLGTAPPQPTEPSVQVQPPADTNTDTTNPQT